jgi:hypothetical protein
MHLLKQLHPLALAGVIALAAAASAQEAPVTGTTSVDLAVDGARIHVLAAVRDARSTVLTHRVSSDGGVTWSAPVPIEPSRDAANDPSRNNDPQIAADGDRLTVVWSAKGTSDWGAGPLDSAYSLDGGRTWRAGGRVNDDGSTGEHAFVDITSAGTGRVVAVWLDLRDGAHGLRTAASDDQGRTWRTNASIDTRTCECCWNTVATGWDGVLLSLYRDIPRDMSLARSTDGGLTWTRSGWVGAFGWTINGCPDVGGGLTRGARPGELVALVWTGHEDRPGLYAVTSTDNGRTWGEPTRIGHARARHGDIAGHASGMAASYDASVDGRVHVGWAYSTDGGRTWLDAGVLSTPDRRATHPRLAATSAGIVAAWTETDRARGHVSLRLERLPLPRGGAAAGNR